MATMEACDTTRGLVQEQLSLLKGLMEEVALEAMAVVVAEVAILEDL